MKKIILILIIFSLTLSCSELKEKETKTYIKTNNIDSSYTTDSKTEIEMNRNDFEELKKYIGKYPKQSDFFKNPLIINRLKKILKSDYSNYMEHVSISGCGEMSYKYRLIYGDISQLHVGGYSSIVFIDIDNERLFLFWLYETIKDKRYSIYGDKPTPENVLNLIEQEMNIVWGHVAKFFIKADSINIELK